MVNKDKKPTTLKKSLLQSLFSRADKDETYREDLSKQWAMLDRAERVQFILGAFIGLILFLGALGAVYWVMSLVVK